MERNGLVRLASQSRTGTIFTPDTSSDKSQSSKRCPSILTSKSFNLPLAAAAEAFVVKKVNSALFLPPLLPLTSLILLDEPRVTGSPSGRATLRAGTGLNTQGQNVTRV